MDRFVRIEKLLGKPKALWLQERSVTIAGVGAVGGYALEGLARAGVGKIRIVDFDIFTESNINRQLHALESTLGLTKVAAAKDRVLDINPKCQVEALPLFVDDASVTEILNPNPDLVIDAIDSFNSKKILLEAAYHLHIPTVSSMGAALRTDPSQIRVDDLLQTKKCPLARKLRKYLRKDGIHKGITCVYSTEDVNFEYGQPAKRKENGSTKEERRPRRILGSLPTLTGIFGLIVANTAIYKLLEKYDES